MIDDPSYDLNKKWPPTEVYGHVDPGLKADPEKTHLVTSETKINHISPYIGTEIAGIQISQLSEEGLNELTLYTVERKVLIFRNQDFKDFGADRQIELTKRFGRIQRYSTSGNVKGYPEIHVVYRDAEHDHLKRSPSDDRINRTQWHSDVSYEKQPPGNTFFVILDQPGLGGDTLFASQVEAYKRLSPEFQNSRNALKVYVPCTAHTNKLKPLFAVVGQDPESPLRPRFHPLVRRHPVTGEKALCFSTGFTRRIIGSKAEESDYLLKFLYDHIAKGADFQIRASYRPGTVMIWLRMTFFPLERAIYLVTWV
ncbi:hypothetical protein PAXRUDRAFT_13514 [Paxillus rubicundulus Ve08.2h10]|uniref:TauD/TfdA-like domain-containing protein n=1 Tax=Paxillus rubicundulus Ve08.2h10 TaxID=930991 RepID=A0A0D0D5K1_9AGAM|nr:hypothetical protein PAXRUDRAFT_13514 [Paxillus rubicundulus Ve08.2h10]